MESHRVVESIDDPRLMEDPGFAKAAENLAKLPPEVFAQVATKVQESLPQEFNVNGLVAADVHTIAQELTAIRMCLQELVRRA